MEKIVKKKFKMLSPLDIKYLEDYLRKMAGQGWMIEKFGTFFLTFKKIEPSDIYFYIEGHFHNNVFDFNYNYKDVTRAQVVEGYGWHHHISSNMYQVYTSERDIPKPETDKVAFKKLFKGLLYADLPMVFLLILVLFQFKITSINWSDLIFSQYGLFALTFPVFLSMYMLPFILIALSFIVINVIRGYKTIWLPSSGLIKVRNVFVYTAFILALVVFLLHSYVQARTSLALGLLPLLVGALGPGIGFYLRYRFKNKERDRNKNIRTFVLAIIGILILVPLLTAAAFSTYKYEKVEPMVSIRDFYQVTDTYVRDDKKGSLITPEYVETKEYGGGKSLMITKIRLAHPMFLDMVINHLQETKVMIDHHPLDGILSDYMLFNNGKSMILKQDNVVICIEADFNLDDQDKQTIIYEKVIDTLN